MSQVHTLMTVRLPVECELWCIPAGESHKSDSAFPLSQEVFDRIAAARTESFETELRRQQAVIADLRAQIAAKEDQIEEMNRRAQLAAASL
jgi:hypothetical protein